MRRIKNAITRITHRVLKTIHRDDVVGVWAIANELFQKACILGEVLPGEAPVKSSARAPGVTEDERIAVRIPQLWVLSTVCIDKHEQDREHAEDKKHKPAASCDAAELFFLCFCLFFTGEKCQHKGKDPERHRQAKNRLRFSEDHKDTAAVHIGHGGASDRQLRRSYHARHKDTEGYKIPGNLLPCGPGDKWKECKDRRGGEQCIVTDAHDDREGGNHKQDQTEQRLPFALGEHKERHGGAEVKSHHVCVGIDIADAGGEGIDVLLCSPLMEVEKVQKEEVRDAPELREAGGDQVGVEMGLLKMIEAGHQSVCKEEHEPEHEAIEAATAAPEGFVLVIRKEGGKHHNEDEGNEAAVHTGELRLQVAPP